MDGSNLNLNYLGIKAQSKNEIYRLLTVEAELYLPPQKETSIYFVRDVFHGHKRALYMNEVKVRSVPHIDGLRVENMIWFLENLCEDGLSYLPNDYKKRSINRQWIVNLCNTLNEEGFKEMINEAIKNRESSIIKKYGMEISTDPRIVKALEKTSMLSTSKGRSHLLLREPDEDKNPKKLKEKLEKSNEKLSSAVEKISYLKDEVKSLTDQLKSKREEAKDSDNYADLLNDLFKKGIIDEHGKIIK